MTPNPSAPSSASKGEPFCVGTPFDTDAGADIILTSCDDHRFRVRKAIITLVSPIFSDMFSLPQPKEPNSTQLFEDNLPVIPLSETGVVVDALLRYCYPGLKPDPHTFGPDNVIAIHSAAVKYEVKLIEDFFKPLRLKHHRFLLLLYMEAWENRQEEVKSYAWELLRLPLRTIIDLWPSKTLDQAFRNLFAYHQSVFVSVYRYLCNWDSISRDTSKIFSCSCRSGNTYYTSSTPTDWWQTNANQYITNVATRGPLSSLCRTNELGICSGCSDEVIRRWDTFAEGIKRGTEREAAKVRFKLSWEDLSEQML